VRVSEQKSVYVEAWVYPAMSSKECLGVGLNGERLISVGRVIVVYRMEAATVTPTTASATMTATTGGLWEGR